MSHSSQVTHIPTPLRASLIHAGLQNAGDTPSISLGRGTPGFFGPVASARVNDLTFSCGGTPDRYPNGVGDENLRSLVARQFSRVCGAAVQADELIITNGATQALDLLFREWGFRAGGRVNVAVLTPTWCVLPCNQIRLAGGRVLEIPSRRDATGWRIDMTAAETALQEADMLFIVTPGNPTGSLCSHDLPLLLRLAFKRGVCCVLDLTYAEMIFDDRLPLDAGLLDDHREQLYLVNSLSKTFGMPGVRVGALVSPPRFCDGIAKVFEANVMGVANICQAIAVRALRQWEETNGRWFDDVMVELRCRRQLTCETLERLGFSFDEPAAGYYVFAVPPTRLRLLGTSFAEKLNRAVGVTVVPGNDFDQSGEYGDYFRLSYANPTTMANLLDAMRRIEDFVVNNHF